MATKFQILSNEDKYAIADKLAKAYASFKKDYVVNNHSSVFGVVINTENKIGETLKAKFGEDAAVHITNLVIRRLSGITGNKVIGDF